MADTLLRPRRPRALRPLRWRAPSPRARTAVVGVLLAVVVLAYLFAFVRGSFEYALHRRLTMLGAMLVAGFAQSVATVLFQSVTRNRVLTPSIMGLDSVYVLVQTALVVVWGGRVLTATDGLAKVVVQTLVMVAFATVLFRWLFTARWGNLNVLLLVGVTLGMAFDSLATFLQRVLSPTDYDLLSLRLFARMNSVDAASLPLALGVCVLAGWFVARRVHRLDVLQLGRDVATNLGLDHRRELTTVLVVVSVLIALSTALVGPMTFFGFIAATVARQLVGSERHVHLLPMAFLFGTLLLVGLQFVLEHVFAASGMLTVVLDVVGGGLFLVLLLRKGRL
ncbi:iron chelate uptake ABC transporter family permease subunit [Kineococcus vitellinus]|uniref:iron chelate uptake ABC transporter family permease subunit n=1 Tax=Kineococcus vitellinus TaxID=2696565 RepID=UPI00196A3CAF